MFRSRFFVVPVSLFVILAVAMPSLVLATAGVPTIIGYQGRLTDGSSNLLGGSGTTYYFKFSIWDNSTVGSGSQLWPASSPGSVSATVRQGVFNVNIGDTANSYPDALTYDFNQNDTVYLEVKVSADNSSFQTLSPRQRIAAMAFAELASRVSGTSTSAFGTTTPLANTQVTIEATTTTAIPLTIRGAASQTANLFNVQNSAVSPLLFINATGGVFASSTLQVTDATTLYGTLTGTGLATLSGGLLVNNATSTITNLVMVTATSTSATTTNLAVFGNARFGGTATSTFNSAGDLLVVGSTTLQNFTGRNATTTNATTTNQAITGLGTAAGTFLAADPTGRVIATTTPAGAVASVANADSTLTVSPTTGAVVASLNLGNPNTWTGLQQFTRASTTMFSSYGPSYFGGTATSTFDTAGNLNLASGAAYSIAGASVLNATTLGSAVVASSLTNVGTISTGVWQGTAVGSQWGGTGQNFSAANGWLHVNAGTFTASTSPIVNWLIATSTTATSTFAGAFGIGTTTPWGKFSVELDTYNPGLVVANTGSSTPAFYIGGVNQDGRVGIGTTTDSGANIRTFNVDGNWGGNAYVDAGAYTSTQTVTVTTKALIYHLTNDSGTTDANVAITFNITGLSDKEGSFAYIYTFAQKGITVGSRQANVTIQINGTQVSSNNSLGGTSASQRFEAYVVGYSNGAWHIFSGPSTTDLADLAEWIEYIGVRPQAGELVSLSDSPVKVRRADIVYDDKLIGIVSTDPHTVMGSETPASIPLTLAGRVPVRVSTENGPIAIGDYLTSSALPGLAMKATQTGQTVGRALEPYDGVGPGTILVLAELDYWPGPALIVSPTAFELRLTVLETKVSVLVASTTLDLASLLASPEGLTFGGNITIKGDTIFFGQPYFNSDTAGWATIKQGSRRVAVSFARDYLETPIINATISLSDESNASQIESVRHFVTGMSARGFTISLTAPAPIDLTFNWLATAVKNAKTFSSIDESASEEPQPLNDSLDESSGEQSTPQTVVAEPPPAETPPSTPEEPVVPTPPPTTVEPEPAPPEPEILPSPPVKEEVVVLVETTPVLPEQGGEEISPPDASPLEP